jgi:hypothetical protein
MKALVLILGTMFMLLLAARPWIADLKPRRKPPAQRDMKRLHKLRNRYKFPK